MLKVENISTGYGKKQVLYDVSFEIKEGEIVLLTGGNGSGKSTLLKVIYGLLPLWQGNIYFNNENISNLPTSIFIRKGLVYIPQNNNLFEDMTIEENLIVSGHVYDKSLVKERIKEVYKLPRLFEIRKRKPFNLSGGEKKLLAFGIALIHRPNMVLFDEPVAGLDTESQKIISELIEKSSQNTTYLVIEHRLKAKFNINRTIHMDSGRILKPYNID